jgi:blue copper oxidase
MDPARIDAALERGRTEIWEVQNASEMPHNFHPHGVTFTVLRYAAGAPPGELAGPKDTIYVPPGETVWVAVRPPDHADRDHPYMFHCPILQHEDRGMMGQFVVLEPGALDDDRDVARAAGAAPPSNPQDR